MYIYISIYIQILYIYIFLLLNMIEYVCCMNMICINVYVTIRIY